jgi:hypothetical protein
LTTGPVIVSASLSIQLVGSSEEGATLGRGYRDDVDILLVVIYNTNLEIISLNNEECCCSQSFQ